LKAATCELIRATKSCANDSSDFATQAQRFLGCSAGRIPSGIAELDAEYCEPIQAGTQAFPERFDGNHQVEQPPQVMSFRKENLRLLKACLELLLSALLSVETRAVEIWLLSGAELALHAAKVRFCLPHPFPRRLLHRAASPR